MKIKNINENSYVATLKIGFLEISFIIDKKVKKQFAIIKNPTTTENLTRLFNKEGKYSSFLIKDEEIPELFRRCEKFVKYCTKETTVSGDTIYENMQNIYDAIENSNMPSIIHIKGDMIWYLTKKRLYTKRK